MNKSLVYKFSLISVLLVLTAVGIIGGMFYFKVSGLLVNNALSDITEKINVQGNQLQSHILSQRQDTLFFASLSAVKNLTAIHKDDDVGGVHWISHLQEIFISKIAVNSDYLSIRYINVRGVELVHVGHEGDQVKIFSDGELQDKSNRKYVRETLKLAPGEIYISEINLNREHGDIVEPHQEVLRSATPVYNHKTGLLVGMIALTAEVGHELRDIQKQIHGQGRKIYIANDHGGYLLHPDSDKTYGFDLGKQFRVQEDVPLMARLFLPENNDMNLTLLPRQTGGKSVAAFTKIHFDPTKPERFIAVGIIQPYDVVVSENTSVLNELIAWAVLLTFMAAILGVILSIRMSRPIKQITQAVDDFTHQRSSLVVLPVNYHDEIGVLARAFEYMTQQVEESRNNLAHLNDSLESLIEERTASLEKSELRQRTVLDTIADAVITINENGLIDSFNPAAVAIFGYQVDEIVGKNVSVLLPDDERHEHEEYISKSKLVSPRIISLRRDLIGRKKDGEFFQIELNVAPIKGERGFVGVLRDITERKRVEQVINRFKSTLDATLDCIFMFEPDSLEYFYVNQGAIDQVGYSYEQLMKMRPYDIKPEYDEAQFRSMIAPMLSGKEKVKNFETIHQHVDGHLIPVEIFLQYVSVVGETPRFVVFVRDITERKRIDKMKNEFVSTVSHELRTPLTSIRGSLGLITGGAMGELPAPVNSMLTIASNNTERLLLLINDILDIQKIESGQMSFNFESMRLIPFIKNAVESNLAYGEQHGVKFVINQVADDVSVYADSDRLMQVMSNLLSNAAKFSSDGDEVEINVALHYDRIRISVSDHGIGIPENFHAKIFEKFTQSDSSDTRQKGGTGLGLSISKVIIEKHGGRIDFVSRVGVGTTFFIELPYKDCPTSGGDAQALDKLPPVHCACILIVEDDPQMAAMMRRMMAEAGCNCDIACNTEQAHEMLEQNPGQYRAITLDINLPGEGGVSFLKNLRDDPLTKDIPVVVISVAADEAKKQLSGGAMGVVDWLPKPFDHQRLIDAVKRISTENKKPRVLHVEDEADVHTVVKSMLKEYCEFTWTNSFADSKQALKNEEFDLVLLDIGLPDGSGLDLIEIIEGCAKPPRVVIFSAYDVSEEYIDKVSAVLVKSKSNNRKLADVILGVMKKD